MKQTARLLTVAAAIAASTFGVHSLAEQSIREDMVQSCAPVEVSVYFAPSQYELNEFAEDLLHQAVSRVEHCELAQIEVVGFSDSSGQADFNYRLSEQRAEHTMAYLEEHGIVANTIQMSARGQEGAVSDSGEPLIMRRKVDLRFIPVPPTV